MTFKEVLEVSGMTLKQFSNYFGIPYRTVQDWHAEKRTPPDYVLSLLLYKIENEKG